MTATTASTRREPSTVDEIPDEFLYCKVDGHHWNHRVTFVERHYRPRKKTNREYRIREKQCQQCEGWRFEYVRASGEVEFVQYDMPEGFRQTGTGHDYRRELRKEVIRRET